LQSWSCQALEGGVPAWRPGNGVHVGRFYIYDERRCQ
jgi:hypothetical protein